MKEIVTNVSLCNGHVIKMVLERESVEAVIEELLESSGTFNEDGVSFLKDHVISVEASEKRLPRTSTDAKKYVP
ncbi:hypothetical protein GCM10010954_30070 [Halobacillus andaensis]|uniref:Uncharacterized protein n=1 Tax=Halobacillus andaensis TaxID=1176239 RepID=A0A917EY07_HALAA|nr:hypothetical protein [Halobacillus andaensis]MBP2005110.1 hypothetical protein [Halobacillus andaensis]GGF28935.1 hypothetical protein GCM10010954_30070 [Halobacillus andaensis]